MEQTETGDLFPSRWCAGVRRVLTGTLEGINSRGYSSELERPSPDVGAFVSPGCDGAGVGALVVGPLVGAGVGGVGDAVLRK